MQQRRFAVLFFSILLTVSIGVVAFLWPWGSREGLKVSGPTLAPEVGVVIAVPAEVPLPVEYAGRIVGIRDVEVRPLVGGLLLKRGFEEGAKVTQGQLLFQIDPAPYRVALSRTEAQLRHVQASLRQAEEGFTRIEQLARRSVATDKQREDALAARDQARASVQGSEAEVANAKLNLSYTEVRAPITGLTSLQSPSIGTLIQAQQTLLTTITPQDRAYVSFSFTDEEGQTFRELNERRRTPITEKDLSVELLFGTNRVYPHRGKVDISAPRVDPKTGTIQARAIFPNPDGLLLPGQFVRLRILGITLPDAIVILKEAVSQGPQGPFVYVVGANGEADVRPVRLGQEIGLDWVISEGLKGGERVVVDGVIRVRPGAQVKPVKYVPQSAPGAQETNSPPVGIRP